MAGLLIFVGGVSAEPDRDLSETDPNAAAGLIVEPQAYDYDPYRVLIWLVGDASDPSSQTEKLSPQLLPLLDREFASVWRTDVSDAPTSVATAARRGFDDLDFAAIAGADPVLAVKKTHPEIVRIRFAGDVGRYVQRIESTADRIAAVEGSLDLAGQEREAAMQTPKFDWVGNLQPIEGDSIDLAARWAAPDVEAILCTRGAAETLRNPPAKIIDPPVSGMVATVTEAYDKVFIVHLDPSATRPVVRVVEFDALMRHFGAVVTLPIDAGRVEATTAAAILKAFRPMVRIDNAGTKTADGLIRAGGLIASLPGGGVDHPAMIRIGDALMPMVRKDDRNGNPIAIGPLDWSYLYVIESNDRLVKMDIYSGRPGGLQGRQNSRTFRVALRVQPQGASTTLRLHAQGNPAAPLIGYELYERELDGPEMTFVGRTDWDGRLPIGQSDQNMRLLYVKNGGAVLARLPVVPGLEPVATADLAGDDMRLQAEAYIRGVQGTIIDLVAIRQLFKARIEQRIEAGEVAEANDLLVKLQAQKTNETLRNDMGKKQTMFLKAIGRDANQRAKVDNLFQQTSEMLSKHISPKLIAELEVMVNRAKAGS